VVLSSETSRAFWETVMVAVAQLLNGDATIPVDSVFRHPNTVLFEALSYETVDGVEYLVINDGGLSNVSRYPVIEGQDFDLESIAFRYAEGIVREAHLEHTNTPFVPPPLGQSTSNPPTYRKITDEYSLFDE
jgi:hypothetical protein